MRKSHVTIYDLQMRKVAYLENAANVSFETPLNTLWSAAFELPIDDPKNEYCQSFYFVELWDGDVRLDLFRILPHATQRSAQMNRVQYQCEHVLATLLDDVMFRYHTVGNLGVPTAQVIQYVLGRQSSAHWQAGNIEFTRQFEYNWENTNLLSALYSIPKPFVDDYMWTWDTTSYPWTINLVAPSDDVQSYIRYGRNMRGITKEVDPTHLTNRIYALGYGEGVNQLTFAEINGGLPYVEDTASQALYGIKATVWADRRFEHQETLLGRAESLLSELKDPRITYSVQAAELYALTKDPIDRFKTGAIVRVQDPDIGIDVRARVVNVRKRNVIGMPGDVEIEIANRPQDIAGTISDLQNRMKIEEVYAQGATNYDSRDFADNCGPSHPAILKFYFPEETARINKIMLSYQNEAFRASSRAIAGGGGTTTSTASGGSSTPTSSSGGGVSTSTAAGGSSTPTTSSQPQQTPTTSSQPQQTPTSGSSSTSTTASGGGTIQTSDVQVFRPGVSQDMTVGSGSHNHGIPNGTQLATAGGGAVTFSSVSNHDHGLYNHAHQVDIPDHSHGMAHTHTVTIAGHNHTVTIPGHNHTVTIPDHTHNITIPAHTHTVTIASHTHGITLPDHTHAIEHGIFQGPTATAVTVRVDGNVVPGLGVSVTDVDIIPYLSKDGSGKIQRGWHEVSITPNSLSRMVASIFTQIFAQSRGGGDY